MQDAAPAQSCRKQDDDRGRDHRRDRDCDRRDRSRSRDRSRDRRARPGLGHIAAAAIEQWGLDEEAVLSWASQKGLPGVGIADLTRYREEHPEEDALAGLADLSGD